MLVFSPFSSVRGVVLSLQGFSDVFHVSGAIRTITQAAILDLKSGYWHFFESFSLDREAKCRKISTWRRR